MLFGVVASNEDGSRFFAVSAPNATLALSYVRETIGGECQIELDELEPLIQTQYRYLAELGTS